MIWWICPDCGYCTYKAWTSVIRGHKHAHNYHKEEK